MGVKFEEKTLGVGCTKPPGTREVPMPRTGDFVQWSGHDGASRTYQLLAPNGGSKWYARRRTGHGCGAVTGNIDLALGSWSLFQPDGTCTPIRLPEEFTSIYLF